MKHNAKKINRTTRIKKDALINGLKITFADGTEFHMFAKVKHPPAAAELNTEPIELIDERTGSMKVISDQGIMEVMRLAAYTDGMNFEYLLTRIIDALIDED